VDKVTMEDFETDLRGNLYRIWNPSDSDAGIPAYSASWVARLEPR